MESYQMAFSHAFYPPLLRSATVKEIYGRLRNDGRITRDITPEKSTEILKPIKRSL
jgi:galactose-1-phosphate uridylyltransferase